ncbi:S-adenosyl-L-methionine-dependent methyltransferase [Hypoxylon sp. NC1633]|nr:S-adenosyl-L-methionine-dependent methyltransferase [Hypoxylon sp. NC1633]
MFGVRSSVRNVFSPLRFYRYRASILSPNTQWTSRTLASKSSDIAEKLAATGLWTLPQERPKTKFAKISKPKIKADKTRVNIVSKKLCDDVFSYVGSSLDRHRGCDILDIYPGAGLWSRKLHDYLKPRSHILMEPDAALYEPFLKPLLDRPNTTLVPVSGLIWPELNSVLTPDYLPHQVPPDATRLTKRNDTLLVTANIAFHPKKRFLAFESLATLVLYQFVEAIRSSSLFQRYGLVRMLVWTRHDDKYGLLPKVMQKRKKLAIDSELSCEWVREVCGREGPDSPWFVRDSVIDASSSLAVWNRMAASGEKIPAGRMSEGLVAARLAANSGKAAAPGSTPPIFRRPFQEALLELEAAHEEQGFTKDSDSYKNMRGYRWRANWEDKKHRRMFDMITRLDAITALYKSGRTSPEEIERLESEWEASLQSQPKGFIDEFVTYKDNIHYCRQNPPLLHWDRREYDMMVVQPEEFLPNIPCSLIDIQPKEIHPLLRQMGPKSNRAGDCFGLIMSSMMAQSTLPVSQTLDALMPGAADYIMPRWKSAKDVDRGGIVTNARHAELTPRMLNAQQWEELLELWFEWPFRPGFHELVARTHDELADEGSMLASE